MATPTEDQKAAEYEAGYRSILEHEAGVFLPEHHDGRLSLDRRRDQIAAYRAAHPEATEAEYLRGVDYEEYRRAIAEQCAVLKLRELEIQRLRGVVDGLRGIIDRMRGE